MPVCFSDYDLLGNQLSATDGSGALMSKYYNRNFKEYIWNRNIYYYYTDKIKEIEKREKEINDELKWQGMVNRGAYKEIDQKNFNNIPLFNGTVAKTGCGIVAAVNLASMSGVDVDVDEALKYFNQPENRYNKAGAVRPSAITAYLYTKGLQTESSNYLNLQNNSMYIIAYKWIKPIKNEAGEITKESDYHYAAFTTDSEGKITVYNVVNNGPFDSYSDFAMDEQVYFTPIFAKVTKY